MYFWHYFGVQSVDSASVLAIYYFIFISIRDDDLFLLVLEIRDDKK